MDFDAGETHAQRCGYQIRQTGSGSANQNNAVLQNLLRGSTLQNICSRNILETARCALEGHPRIEGRINRYFNRTHGQCFNAQLIVPVGRCDSAQLWNAHDSL